jgi:hypothetical protein
MRRQIVLVLIPLCVLCACSKQVDSDQPSPPLETLATEKQGVPGQTDRAQDGRDSTRSEYPYGMEWIPGQRDTEDFDVLSKFRAHANRVSKDALILTLETPATAVQSKGASPAYLVADSAIIAGLLPNEIFTNYCKIGSAIADGQIGGIPTTAIWDQWQHPRLAWQFDTLRLRIRSVAADSVSCILLQPDD